ncbi:MAG: M3 family oligoendopeptidase, partial [Planctomycetota bacterium]
DIDSLEAFETWLVDRSELDAAVGQAKAELYVVTTCRTDDTDARDSFRDFLDNVEPIVRKLGFELDKKKAELFARFPLDDFRYEVDRRDVIADVELFREENIAINTKLSKLDNKYDQICGAMTVQFEGEERTIPQMNKFLQRSDRSVRESAWRKTTERRLDDRDAVSEIFDEMIVLREQVAKNAGYDRYTEFNFKTRHRFDYGVPESIAFHEAVEQVAVPFMSKLDARRQKNLGIDTLRPWDLGVDEHGREPLSPFKTADELVEKTRKLFDAMDPELSELFRELGNDMGGSFDLASRRGKASGGYQYMRDKDRKPFIFMNAAGMQRDVDTMIHEAGHAFHSMLCRDEPLVQYRHSPIEFAEVASMTMELLAMPHIDAFYEKPADADRARRQQLEGSLAFFPWCATIDAFQHWVYDNPTHTREERKAHWLELDQRFGHAFDWSGLEDARATLWQRQGHLFGGPFYYIEYGIAQLGALGIWLISLEKGPAEALRLYKKGLSLGGSRPLPELFEAAGVPFDFSAEHMQRIREAVETELAKLPE